VLHAEKEMKRTIKIILIIIIAGVIYKWLDLNDYYQVNYLELSEKEQELFEWKSHYDEFLDHRKAYEKYFDNDKFKFPRQEVSKIKMLEKDKVFKTFWISRTLKQERVTEIVGLFNNTLNFDWGETTWGDEDVDYIFKFYDKSNRLIGKVDICYHDCGMVRSKPFTPNIKYGQLTHYGHEALFLIIYKLDYWK